MAILAPFFRAVDANGDPVSGALLYFYTTGTLAAASVYTTDALNVAHANPVVADAGGLFAPIYLDSDVEYRAILKTSAGSTIQDIDPLPQFERAILNTAGTDFFYSEQGAKIHRLNDRLFIAGATDNLGTNTGSQPDWLTTFMLANTRTFAFLQVAQAAVLTQDSAAAANALVGGARTSNFATLGNAIGVIGVGINNNTTVDTNAYGGYDEGWRVSGALGGAYGREIEIINLGSSDVTDPYAQATSQTIGLQIAAGGEVTATSASAAINIRKNGGDFLSGIVFGSDALKLTAGIGEAVAFAAGHKMQWYGAAGVKTSAIYCDATTAPGGASLHFAEGSVKFDNASGKALARIANTASGVNYLAIINSIAGAAAQLAAEGDDTNIDLFLNAKGTGVLKFGVWTTNADAAVNGYVTIKDAAGNTRKLATIA